MEKLKLGTKMKEVAMKTKKMVKVPICPTCLSEQIRYEYLTVNVNILQYADDGVLEYYCVDDYAAERPDNDDCISCEECDFEEWITPEEFSKKYPDSFIEREEIV